MAATRTPKDPSGRESSDVSVDLWTDPDGTEWRLCIEWKVMGGRLEVIALDIRSGHGESALSPALVRRVPLANIINARRLVLAEDLDGADSPEPLSETAITRSLLVGGPDSTRRLADADLQAVAHFYRQAYRAGLPVQRHIADKFGISIPTAARRIARARQRGFIDDRFVQNRGRARAQEVAAS
jgi:hypothetical protein